MLAINDLKARLKHYDAPIQQAIARVMTRGWLVLGPEVTAFEQAFARYIGQEHCVGVANGTDALELALRAVGVNAGDTVATVANAGMYTTMALLTIGAQPCYVDVELDTALVSLESVTKTITQGVKAIVITHLYGRPVADTPAIAALCQEKGVVLIEDCAQAHGAMVQGKKVGSFADAATFSFYPTKNLGALGDGGAVVCAQSTVAQRLQQLRQYGWGSKYSVDMAKGRNSRLDELQAAILNDLLPHLDDDNDKRRTVEAYYRTQLKHPLVKPFRANTEHCQGVSHLFVVRCEQQQALREHLKRHDIATDVHYPIPDHQQAIIADQYRTLVLANTEQLVGEIVTLPCYPELPEKALAHVVSAVNQWSL